MPIAGINWDYYKGAMVVHVLAGTTSPDLRVRHLRFQIPASERIGTRTAPADDHDYPFAKAYLDDPANGGDVTLSFTIADASAQPGASTRSFAAHGITVDRNTGAVTVAASLTDPFPRNFHLEVVAVSGTDTFKELIRVEVHRSIERIWLTPPSLRVRARRNATLPATTLSKFAVRARFDDGVVGDITEFLAIDWSPSRNVDADGRLIVAAGDAGGPPITITAALTDHPSVAPATATLRVVEPWGPSTPIETRLVPGGGWPNPLAIEAVPNVLFLPDGFDPSWESDFYRYVNALVQFLKTDPVCKPFDLLATSMNFWAAFIPSEQAGVTMGSEVFEDEIMPDVQPVMRPKRPQGVSDWWVGELVYEVGMPVPSDALSNTARTDAQIIAEWTALGYNPRLPTAAHRRDLLIHRWRLMASRTLLDDLDTPLGIRSGSPRADLEHNGIEMNRDRMDRDRLEDLMSALRHDDFATSGLDLSTLWVGQLRRNYDLVCVIVPTEGRAANFDGFFIVQQDPSRSNASSSGPITLPPPTFNATPSPLESRLLAHEFGHSFDLGDEYGGSETTRLNAPRIARAQQAYTNLVSPDSLLRSAGSTPRIHGDEIKWRWPRVRWAAELIGPITARGGGVFEAPIRWSHSFAIPIGELVHLRYRNIDHAFRDVRYVEQSSYLTKGVKVSVPLRLVETFETGSPRVQNVRLRVESSAPFGHAHSTRVEPADFAAEFPAGSIVYAPTPAPSSAFDATDYPYAELIAKNVKDYITRRVVEGRSAAVGGASTGFPEVPDYDGFTFPHCFPTAEHVRVVALYEGGIGNDLGMFHPTGNCMMSDQDSGSQYCWVCRYTLVDAIDPGKHYFLDRAYDPVYPER